MANADWARLVDTSDEWILERSGIRERRFAAEGETTVDLGEHAARAALADAGLRADQLDEIVVATDTPEVYCPDTAAYLQHRLGAREVPAYDLAGSGCAGFLQALDVARARAQVADKRILVCGIELISRLLDWTDRNTCVLFGDGAGAAVIGPSEDGPALIEFVMGTDGGRADILGRTCGGTRMPFTLEAAQSGKHLAVQMDGREVFKEAVHRMTEAARTSGSRTSRSSSPTRPTAASSTASPSSSAAQRTRSSATSSCWATRGRRRSRSRSCRRGRRAGSSRATWSCARRSARASTGARRSSAFRQQEGAVLCTAGNTEARKAETEEGKHRRMARRFAPREARNRTETARARRGTRGSENVNRDQGGQHPRQDLPTSPSPSPCPVRRLRLPVVALSSALQRQTRRPAALRLLLRQLPAREKTARGGAPERVCLRSWCTSPGCSPSSSPCLRWPRMPL